MNILIIEDDEHLARKLGEVFQNKILTNRVKILSSYLDFLNDFHQITSYDIILTDILLRDTTGKTGMDILKIIRQKTLTIPVVIMSAISTYESLEGAFHIGANDYIIKPFRLRELEIRVMKRFYNYAYFPYSLPGNRTLSYYELQYNIQKNCYLFEKQYIKLPKRSKYILSLFLIQPEVLLSEQFLIEKIWGDYDMIVGTRNIRVCILRLKEKLQEFGVDTRVRNIRGEGYILEKTS